MDRSLYGGSRQLTHIPERCPVDVRGTLRAVRLAYHLNIKRGIQATYAQALGNGKPLWRIRIIPDC